MIRFAVIHRAKDGLALSASTDLDSSVELRDSKRYAKILSKKARQFPNRCLMKVGRFNICLVTESDVCFLMICEATYAYVLAFSFLDELKKEFFTQFTRGTVKKAVRPYSFIEFDAQIQKAKQKYNSTRSLNARVNLADISDDLQANPPYEITHSDLGVGSLANGAIPADTVVSGGLLLRPLSWFALISFGMTVMCAFLHLVRLVPFVSQHDPEDDSEWMLISLVFFLSAGMNLVQCYLLLRHVRQRMLFNVLSAVASFFFLYYLNHLRSNLQVAFHFTAIVCMSISIRQRGLMSKLPNYNV